MIKPSRDSQKRHRRFISEKIDKLRAATQDAVIGVLNPIIRGWANYYRHQVSRKAFENADNHMFYKLWKWARWRHPNLGLKRIKRKYFRQFRNSNWRFSTHDGKVLTLHGDIHIIRHMKIHGTRSPYDEYNEYWKKHDEQSLRERCI